MTINIVALSFTCEIHALFNAIVGGQIRLRKESQAKRAAALFPLIAHKLCTVTGRDAAVEDSYADTITCSTIGNACTHLVTGVSRQNLTRTGRYFDMTRIVELIALLAAPTVI